MDDVCWLGSLNHHHQMSDREGSGATRADTFETSYRVVNVYAHDDCMREVINNLIARSQIAQTTCVVERDKSRQFLSFLFHFTLCCIVPFISWEKKINNFVLFSLNLVCKCAPAHAFVNQNKHIYLLVRRLIILFYNVFFFFFFFFRFKFIYLGWLRKQDFQSLYSFQSVISMHCHLERSHDYCVLFASSLS